MGQEMVRSTPLISYKPPQPGCLSSVSLCCCLFLSASVSSSSCLALINSNISLINATMSILQRPELGTGPPGKEAELRPESV